MPRRTIPLVAGNTYHVYNRGNNRQKIFVERDNYLFFLRRVRQYLRGEPETSEVLKTLDVWVDIVAYCLMPNHFHLLVCPQDGELSRRMQRLGISYTKAMNKRYNRSGALFEGQFQAVHVDRDEYLVHLSRYIHLNPVEAGLCGRPEDWEFSSYRDYAGLRQGTLPRSDMVLEQFSSRDDYRAFVESFRQDELEVISHLLFEDG
jgi:putative transposase